MSWPYSLERHFAAVGGSRNCTDCRQSIDNHEANNDYACPRGSVPTRVMEYWRSLGNRPVRPALAGCNCARCIHS